MTKKKKIEHYRHMIDLCRDCAMAAKCYRQCLRPYTSCRTMLKQKPLTVKNEEV